MADPAASNRPTFEQAVRYVRTAAPARPFTNNEKLHMYGLFKQAMLGDAPRDPPGLWTGFEARAKWEVWAKFRGQSAEACKTAYVDTLLKLTQ